MKIHSKTIETPDKMRLYTVIQYDNFEYVNPIEQVASMYINSNILFEKRQRNILGIQSLHEITDEQLIKMAIIEWHQELERYKSIDLPKGLFALLEAKSKNEQIQALKGLSLTSDELIAFIFMAYEKHGYKFSQYKAHHNHKGLDETNLPELIHVEDNGKIVSIGSTSLTEGQQKQLIEQRKVVVSKFLDTNNQWHCFFLTFKSLSGKENYKNGQPHLHYISDKWNIDRTDVLEQLTNKDYHLPSLPHIDFHTHRNPR